MSRTVPKIFIVDDDAPFSKSLSRLVRSIGFKVETFASAREFLNKEILEEPCCLILDLRMPGLTGLELQAELAKKKTRIPIIFLTAHGDIPTSVKAVRGGAVDFLLKPVKEEKLFQAIDRALDESAQIKKKNDEIRDAKILVASLTQRELEVLRWVITGMLNKQVASALGITERTIKAHRSQIMHKLNVISVAELVRLAEKAGIVPANPTSGI